MALSTRWLLAGALFLALSSQLASAAPGGAPCGHGRGVCGPLHVPGQFRTMQAAIDAASDGATIVVGAGVLTDPFRVEGKRLRIIGSDDGRTEIVSSSLDVPLASYANGGGGELKNIVFRGGACAVCGSRDASGLPSALALKNVTASGGYRGIFGAFSSLDVKNVEVVGTRWHGISITHASVKLKFGDVEVHDAGGVGLIVFNGGAGNIAVSGHFHHNTKGGIEILGHNGNVDFVLAVVDHNPAFGVLLLDATAGMALSSLAYNGHATPTGCQGAGLWPRDSSSITVTGTIFQANCIGIFNDGSSVAMGSDTFDTNDAELGHEPGLPFNWVDLGGLVCGENLGTPSETLFACQDFTLDIQAPEPPFP